MIANAAPIALEMVVAAIARYDAARETYQRAEDRQSALEPTADPIDERWVNVKVDRALIAMAKAEARLINAILATGGQAVRSGGRLYVAARPCPDDLDPTMLVVVEDRAVVDLD